MPTPRIDAREVIWAVAAELQRRHGITRIYGRATPALGVLSICAGLTVWTDGTALRWHDGGITITWRAADAQGAADRLAAVATAASWNAGDPARKTAPRYPCAATPGSGAPGHAQHESHQNDPERLRPLAPHPPTVASTKADTAAPERPQPWRPRGSGTGKAPEVNHQASPQGDQTRCR